MNTPRATDPMCRHVRLTLALLAAALAIPCACTGPAGKPTATAPAEPQAMTFPLSPALEHLARSDHVTFLEYCLRNCQANYRDYTCAYAKQEVIAGVTRPRQEMQVKLLATPFSVCVTWTSNPPLGDKVLYVEGRYGNRMLVRPATPWIRQITPTVFRAPDDPEALQNTLRPVNLFGFERNLQSYLRIARLAAGNGDLKQSYGGYAAVHGRWACILIRELPDKPCYPNAGARAVLFIDTQYLIPTRVQVYDRAGRCLAFYEYSQIRFNAGLTLADFRPEANGLSLPHE